jgi:hypothetical protein
VGAITLEQVGGLIPESLGGISPEWWAQSLRNHQPLDAKKKLASDSTGDGFLTRFPDAGRIRVDTFGIQPKRQRIEPMSAKAEADFYARFPDARRLK